MRRNLTDGLRELNVKSWEGFVDRYALAAAPSAELDRLLLMGYSKLSDGLLTEKLEGLHPEPMSLEDVERGGLSQRTHVTFVAMSTGAVRAPAFRLHTQLKAIVLTGCMSHDDGAEFAIALSEAKCGAQAVISLLTDDGMQQKFVLNFFRSLRVTTAELQDAFDVTAATIRDGFPLWPGSHD